MEGLIKMGEKMEGPVSLCQDNDSKERINGMMERVDESNDALQGEHVTKFCCCCCCCYCCCCCCCCCCCYTWMIGASGVKVDVITKITSELIHALNSVGSKLRDRSGQR